MPAVASLKDLEAVQLQLELLKADNEDFYLKFRDLIKKHRQVGYKNICKLILEETTPKKLKGLEN